MGRKCPKPGVNRSKSALNPLKPARTLMGNKTGAKSTAELATRPAYVRSFERLSPPADLTTEGERKLFLDIVLANEPAQFRASDAPLLAAYVRAVEMERTASAHLEREGHIVETGDAQELFSFPQNAYTQDLLAAVPHLGSEIADAAPDASRAG